MPDPDPLEDYLAAREKLKAAEANLRASYEAETTTPPPPAATTPAPAQPAAFDWLTATPQECAAESQRLGLAGTLTSPDWRFRR